MDEGFEQQIKNALSDPDIMQKVSGVLAGLSGSSGNADSSSAPSQSAPSPPAPSFPGLSGLSNLSSIPQSLSNIMPQDDRTRLLLAIKPFLSEKRAPYMDSAVNILKLVSIGKIGKDLKLF